MKQKLFTLLTLLLCVASGAWADDISNYAAGFEENSTTNYDKGECGSIAISTDAPRTGSYCLSTVYTGGTGNKRWFPNATFAVPKNSYFHVIGYAKLLSTDKTSASTSTQAYADPYVGTAKGGSPVNLTTSWQRITGTSDKASSNKTGAVARFYRKHANKLAVLFDDVIAYVSTSSSIDLTAPTQATSASATTSAISWTNGSDTGDGATGIQKTLIFKRTGGSSDDLTLNDQGIYSLTSTEGPSTDQSGHWTLVTASVAADATSYNGDLDGNTRYAIVHRDLAYNYSTPTYITTPAAKTTVTLSLTSTSGSKDIAAGRSFNFSTLTTLSSDPDESAITDNITYSSSDTDVAVINENTGAITLKKAGETTITASFEGDETYNEASVDYTLTVTNSTDFTADLRSKSSGSYGIAADGSEVAVDNPSAVVTLTMSGYNGADHGWNPGTVITVPVTGPAKIVLGTCKFGNGAVTVTNSSDETVLSFSTNDGTCYHSNTTNNIVTRYYDGGATTLTITVNNYLPYVAVSAVGLDEVKYPVTFDVSGASITAGSAPSTVLVQKGGNFTIPANNSLYVADKTLTGWTYSGTPYNIGETISDINNDITLTPNFENNAFELDELTAETTVNFYLNQGNGAPVMAASGGGSTMRVAQATVATQSIDVLMNVTSSTKFNNNQGAESAQITASPEVPTTIQVPGVAGMTVTMNADFATSYLGESTNTGTYASSITTWTYDGSDDPVTLTLISNGYPSLMTVTYPVKPTCATPTITPATFTSDNQEITIGCETAGATIYYTLDGSTPTTSSDVYDSESKPTVSSTTTFKAYAVKSGSFDSAIATQTVTRTTPVTWGSWDFANWSDATKTGVKADGTNWRDYETSGEDKPLDKKCYSNKAANSTFVYGSPATTIPETEGLTFATTAYTFGLAFDLGEALGTYHGSQYLWLYGSSSTITIPNVPAGATVTIGIESHKTSESRQMNVSNASPANASVKTYEEKSFTVSATGDVTINPNNKGMHIYYITITENVATEPISTASGKKYATYVTTNDLDFSSVSSNIKAYVAGSTASAGSITFTGKDAVPAGTPVLIKTTSAGATVNVPVATTTPAAVGTNYLVAGTGSNVTYDAGANHFYYILTNGEFKQANNSPIAVGKAYLALPSAATANELTINFDDEAGDVTGIATVSSKKQHNGEYFNLNGQRVDASHKGIVIVNGKKFFNK